MVDEQSSTLNVPAPALRWIMRVLAVFGFGIASFLWFTHVAAHWAAAKSTVPFCSGLSWLDCESVLNSRYAAWLGVPVALPAAVAYLVMIVALFAMGRRRSPRAMRRLWWCVVATATAAGAAAGWFIYLQLAVLGQLCSYCMVEHTVGILLCLLVWLYAGVMAKDLRRALAGGAAVGLLGAGALVLGQMLVVPRYTDDIKWNASGEQWVEPADEADRVPLYEGHVVLDRRAHPVLGLPTAKRHILEVIDFTCGRCRMVNDMMRQARPHLPPDVAVLIVFAPQSSDCNPEILETSPPYVHSCALAKLAIAVWLADPSAYSAYHEWLFDHQKGMEPDAARAQAIERVGRAALDNALADPRVDRMIARDLALATRLEVGHLPGLIIGDRRFSAIPEEAREFTRIIRWALRAQEATGDATPEPPSP